MKKLLPFLILLAAGCGPQQPGQETVRTVYPAGLSVEVNDASMTLSWKKMGKGPISGYNIYISREPLVAKYPDTTIASTVETYNVTPFPGDTNPEDEIEYFDATKLDNGVKYFVSVRVVYPDRSVSKPSNEVIAVCGPRGEIELAIRFNGEHDGFSFEENQYVNADGISNDLYFFSKDGVDYLASPKRLDGFINVDDQVFVGVGNWVLLKCASGSYALVKVLGFSGAGADRLVRLSYAYSTLVGEIFF